MVMITLAQSIRDALFLISVKRLARKQRKQAFTKGWLAYPDSPCPYHEMALAEAWWDGHEAYAVSVQEHVLLPGRYGKRLSVLAIDDVTPSLKQPLRSDRVAPIRANSIGPLELR